MTESKKDILRTFVNKFCLEDNLFDLMIAMKVAVEILEENEFPIKGYSQFKYKNKRYEK
jgi:hypothetical protein